MKNPIFYLAKFSFTQKTENKLAFHITADGGKMQEGYGGVDAKDKG